jgi:phosphoribosylglycinamide formyltransferase-1
MTARLGILLSGAGTTYENLADSIRTGKIEAEIAVVISSRAEANGLDIARANGHAAVAALTPDEVTCALRRHRAEWVVMCGYNRYWNPPSEFAGRTVNIHPSLLPEFGGKGMYGLRVHEAVLQSGARTTGCTVHWVSGSYDSGRIIAQKRVEVRDGDTAQSLQERVQEAERELYPTALATLMRGKM